MKIAIVTGSAGDNQCGVGDYAWELAQHLALDAEVHVYHDKHHGPARPAYEKLNTLLTHEVKGFSLLTLNRLVRELREQEYDIIHIQYPSKGFGTSVGPGFLPQNLSGMKSRSRLVLTLHEWHTSHPLRKAVMDQMLPHVDGLVLSNEQEIQALSGKMGSRPIMCLPVGNVLRSQAELAAIWLEADGQPVAELPEPAGPEGRIPFSLFHYGLPAKGKGLKLLIEMLHLTREAGVPAVLHLGGEFTPGEKLTEELLGLITELELTEAVVRLGQIPWGHLQREVERCQLGLFPFKEGFSSKRSSVATISHLDLPLIVGAGSSEEHPYYAPEQNTAASLSVLLVELLTGRLADDWRAQVKRQREYAERFSFGRIAQGHLEFYQRLRRVDV